MWNDELPGVRYVAAVRFAEHLDACVVGGILLQQRVTAIGGSIVDTIKLPGAIALCQHRIQCLREVLFAVICGDEDVYQLEMSLRRRERVWEREVRLS